MYFELKSTLKKHSKHRFLTGEHTVIIRCTKQQCAQYDIYAITSHQVYPGFDFLFDSFSRFLRFSLSRSSCSLSLLVNKTLKLPLYQINLQINYFLLATILNSGEMKAGELDCH